MTPAEVSAVVLAAGQSRRFGAANKLLHQIDGGPMVLHVLRACREAQIGETVVVTGFDAERVAQCVQGQAHRVVHNESWNDGMGGSVAVGVAVCAETSRAVLVVGGDMPYLQPSTLSHLCAACAGEETIVVSRSPWYTGVPVVFGIRYVEALSQCSGPSGARRVWEARLSDVVFVDVDDAELRDIDSQD